MSDMLAERAESKLSEWDDVDAPLGVAYEFRGYDQEGDPRFDPTTDERYHGYWLWSNRMDWRNIAVLTAGTEDQTTMDHGANRHVIFKDASHPGALVAAVDFIALMENARLSLGLMMVFEHELGTDGERFYCLHHYDVMQRLVSATDRLRTMYLVGLFGLSTKTAREISRKNRYQQAFEMVYPRLKIPVDGDLRRRPADVEQFRETYSKLWTYVRDRKSPIRRIRNKRNDLTHVLGTLAGRRAAEDARTPAKLTVPYFLTTYGALSDERCTTFHEYIEESREDYAQVLQFGAIVFGLEHMIATAA
ncbi:MAG: hypothetical protein GY842_06910 [bacterium]|nr:hypothetical protein [bacterium]